MVFGLITPYALERRNNNRIRHSVLYRLHVVIHLLFVKAIAYNNSKERWQMEWNYLST